MRGSHRAAAGVVFLAVLLSTGLAMAKPPAGAPVPITKQTKTNHIARPVPPGLNKPGTAGAGIAIRPPITSCPTNALRADVVAIDHPMVFNRLGAQNVNWMMYALRHDLVHVKKNEKGEEIYEPFATTDEVPWQTLLKILRQDRSGPLDKSHRWERSHVALRPDLRPRPLVLRVAAGSYLRVRFTNLLEKLAVPPHNHPGNPFDKDLTGFP